MPGWIAFSSSVNAHAIIGNTIGKCNNQVSKYLISKIFMLAAALLVASGLARGNELSYEIRGVEEPVLTNVRSHLESFTLVGPAAPNGRNNEKLIQDAVTRVGTAMRPYGYYKPEVSGELKRAGNQNWILAIQIDSGAPLKIVVADVQVQGDGAGYEPLMEWQSSWPLAVGSVLDQSRWEDEKTAALEIARAQGYLQSEFSEQSINIDLEKYEASLTLIMKTGRRSVMGDVTFEQNSLQPRVLQNIPRFEPGDFYTSRIMEKFRIDLWQTGYFTDVVVVEQRRTDGDHPIVDLQVTLETATRNTYQGSLGLGTDTGARVQAGWSRHPMTSFGDRIDVSLGWQQKDNEFVFRTGYRIPRRSADRQYWTAEALYKTELQDFDFKLEDDDEDRIRLAEGRISDIALSFGRLQVRNRRNSEHQVFATLLGQFVTEKTSRTLLPGISPQFIPLSMDPDFEQRIEGTISTLALGFEWDQPAVRGKGFDTVGSRDQAHLLYSTEAWGSEVDFLQAYVSSRRQFLLGDRWKILMRAEVGYTDAIVDDYSISIENETILLSVTRLQDFYRFKAGGNNSVRGYSFESLSNNDLGSNNVIAASTEAEFRFFERWSAAAFIDIGNAFNDWDKMNLKTGIGVGIRWYSIAGSIRVDVAQALDLEGRPWRVHFAIGANLL